MVAKEIGVGIVSFFVIISILWVCALIESVVHTPFINVINPLDLQWYHYFMVDDTVPYGYAVFVYFPSFWWGMTIGLSIVISIAIVIGITIFE